MTYLIAQITLALVLAGLLGGALGWLVHRATHVRQTDELRHALGRQQSKMVQMQSEVSMLTDDYDELQNQSVAQIEALRQETQQIPFLKTNLEKSQLLVRQMLQKHEAKMRDLNTQNQKLTARVKAVDDREQAYNQVQAELDNRKRLAKDKETADKTSENSPAPSTKPSLNAEPVSANDAPQNGLPEATLESLQSESNDLTQLDEDNLVETLKSDSLSPAEEFIAVTDAADSKTTADPESVKNQTVRSSWASVPLEALEETVVPDGDETIEQTLTLSRETEEGTIDISVVEDDPFDEVMEVGDELQRELGDEAVDDPILDGSVDQSNLFDPVERRDDLKQIFGIGPLTEKALNELGITSYSQLADLKHHDIETIAGVLQIVPGRIERDDWVGNARRQLEDVLEEL